MTTKEFLCEFERVLDRYLGNEISGHECVRRIDDLMAGHRPDGIPNTILNVLDNFQDDLAFYVEDDESQREYWAYYGPDELLRKVKDFRVRLSEVTAGMKK